MPNCLFCDDEEAKVTLEHTLSDSIRSLLPPGPFTVDIFGVRPGLPTSHTQFETDTASFLRRAYCEKCNGGWMQQLDQDTAPLIQEMVEDHSVTLSPTEQTAIATWATKMALVYESLSGRDKAIPDAKYKWFYENRRPFPSEPVQLAHYMDPERHQYVRRPITRRDYVTGDVLGVENVLVTLTIGAYIAFTVLPVNGVFL
ncbi:MAG: hypothetical protein WAL35_08845, partial [Acidimicrobiales bacterium]